MRVLETLILALLLTVFFSISSAADQQRRAVDEPTGLALAITFYKDSPPAYQSVPLSDAELSRSWFARFRRVPNWQQPQDSLPVRAVNIVSGKEADGVRVTLSVFVGIRFHDKEERVASYFIRENETVSTTGLVAFGLEPFEITVLRVPQTIPIVPSVINRTASIVVEGIEAINSTFPSFKLSLRNASTRHVVALQIDVLADGKARLLSRPMGKEGKPLITAAGEFQTNVRGVKSLLMTGQGGKPQSPLEQQILIGTAVFEDGTYEGDPQIAAQIRIRMMAEKLQLKQIVRILENFKEVAGPNDRRALDSLRKQVSSLKDDVDMDVEELVEDLSSINLQEGNRLKLGFEAALHLVKKDLLDEIDTFEKAHNDSLERKEFQPWLNAIRNRYKHWLLRL